MQCLADTALIRWGSREIDGSSDAPRRSGTGAMHRRHTAETSTRLVMLTSEFGSLASHLERGRDRQPPVQRRTYTDVECPSP